jgi:general secretion pathway protein J
MSSNKPQQGFTLIEVLIGLTLLSIMVVLLFTSLKICADSWEKGEYKIAEVNEVSVVFNFFKRHLSAARPLWDDFSNSDTKVFSFQGKSDSFQFVSAFPASVGKSGPQLISLSMQNEDQENVVKVALTPFFPAPEGNEGQKEEVTLIRHVTSLKMSYFGSDDTSVESIWQEQWLEKKVQPNLVKIKIELENEMFWPEMIFEIKAVGATDNQDGDSFVQQEE